MLPTQYFTVSPFCCSSPQPTIRTVWYLVFDPLVTFEHLYTPDSYMKNSFDTFIMALNITIIIL